MELFFTLVLRFFFVFILIRVLQRVYYLLWGYRSARPLSNNLNNDLDDFFKKHDVELTNHVILSTTDGVPLQVKKAGKGSRYILLANGVGTDLFMWLPILECSINLLPDMFETYTFIFPSYRGLFTDEIIPEATEVEVTMKNCMADTLDIMRHFSIVSYDLFIGWSTGAQLAITLCAEQPQVASKLFLLNASTGETLHTVLQPIVPYRHFIGVRISRTIISILKSLIPLCRTRLWGILKTVAESFLFRVFLELLAFLGGFPHYQPLFFHQYMHDAFRSPTHTMALLNLIISLDAPCPAAAQKLPIDTVLISGFCDFLTGVYHSLTLAQSMPRCRHCVFTMGSHFVLIEWPELVAQELVAFIKKSH